MYLKTPLYEFLKSQNAIYQNYEEFLYELPSHFGSPELEQNKMEQSCVWIDFSYYGHLKLKGKHAQDFLNRMSTNDLKKLNTKEYATTVLTNEKGRIVDLITVYLQGDGIVVTTSPQNQEHVVKWFEKYIMMDDVHIADLSGKMIQLGIIGPKSAEALFTITKKEAPEFGRFIEGTYEGFEFLAAPSPQLDLGFVLIADASAAEPLWHCIKTLGIGWCGMETYLAQRIHQKKPIFRRELTEKYNPLEAGLINAVSFSKGCYIGQEVIARLDSYNKIQKHLVRLMSDEPVPLNSKIIADTKEIGITTSSSYSYSKMKNIALGYVKTEFTDTNLPISIVTPEKSISAEFCS